MTAAAWARQYHADLLTQLETEANEGWPDLPWPPEPSPALIEQRQRRALELILIHVYDVMLGDERRHEQLVRDIARRTWERTGQPRVREVA